MYRLFLDDMRQPKDVKWKDMPLGPWVVARNYKEFVDTIQRKGVTMFIAFDHDLGDEAYKEHIWSHSDQNPNKGKIDYSRMKEKTGYDCAKWLVDFCLDNKHKIPEYLVHSMNSIGAENIESILMAGINEEYRRENERH